MTITLTLYCEYGDPPFSLSTDAVRFPAEIGADVDIDLYAEHDEP
jgi:hypothetical protein